MLTFLFSARTRSSLLPLVALALVACSEEPPGAGGGMPPSGPMPVTVVEVKPQSVPVTLEYAAQTAGSREAEVRARVTGILLRRKYTEGSIVKAGESLFTIDPAPFEAALAKVQADVAALQARLAQAQREATRLKPLYESGAVSQKEYDDAVSAEAIMAADAQAAQARLKEARLNLEYTRVEAPITGVAGRALKSEGSLVSGPEVLLTTMTQADPIYILFGIPDDERLKLQAELEAGRLQLPKSGQQKVTVQLANGSEYERTGVVNFTDVRVNANTGSSEARAELANPEGKLHPGEFVRARLTGATRIGVYKVPQRAVQESPQGRFVYVVDAQSKAEVRPVQVGEWSGDAWIITKGLNPGDKVIVDGTLKIGPGAPVQVGDPPVMAAPAGAPASPAPSK